MFERFTRSARGVVRAAVERSERSGGSAVREEHLFLPLLDRTDTPAAAALAALGVTARRDSVERALAEAGRRGGLSRSDTDALAGLGIDVAEVVSRVEQTHGEGALAAAGNPRRHRPRPTHGRFTPGARKVLERALREAVGRGDHHIGDEHILLALVARPGVVADVLADHGATYTEVRRTLARSAAAG